MMEAANSADLKDLNLFNATSPLPDLTTVICLDEFNLEGVGQDIQVRVRCLRVGIVDSDERCWPCGCQGCSCDTVVRRLAVLFPDVVSALCGGSAVDSGVGSVVIVGVGPFYAGGFAFSLAVVGGRVGPTQRLAFG